MEQLLTKHKKEQRELIGQITALKKLTLKKTRRAVNAQCEDLRLALDSRQKLEIEDLEAELDQSMNIIDDPETGYSHKGSEVEYSVLINDKLTVDAEISLTCHSDCITKGSLDSPKLASSKTNTNSDTMLTSEQHPSSINQRPNAQGEPQPLSSEGPKKRNRAKERLVKRQARIDAIRVEALAEAAVTPDYRRIEADTVNKLLARRGLELYEIQPDGHCLFSSLSDQLKLRHGLAIDIKELRHKAARYIRNNRDDFIPYLFNEETMTTIDVDEYTFELETTAMWGSDMEILALAREYDCSIEVLTAGGAPITFNAEANNPRLIIAFFKHSYGLGEHYNSCR